MAANLSPSYHFDSRNLHYHRRPSADTLCKRHQTRLYTLSIPGCRCPLSAFNKHGTFSFRTSSSSSSHSSSSTSSTTTTSTSSNLEDPFRTGRFLTNEELEKLKFLENFRYLQDLESGSMWVRVMKAEEMDATVGLLAESFAESMLLPSGYVYLLKFLIRQYLMQRKTQMPHMATLIGFYRGIRDNGEEPEVQLAGTVEVSFNKKGSSASMPSPTPPQDWPYISNMAVKKSLRRRGIGWHLLKAGEDLISQMSSSRDVYLHCRIIDEAPLNMYIKADYKIVKTDNILVLLTFQRRKHLMCKKLPLLINDPESDLSDSDKDMAS